MDAFDEEGESDRGSDEHAAKVERRTATSKGLIRGPRCAGAFTSM